MDTLTSKDGTKIAYERTGSGPAVIVISGAFCDHHHGTGLARYLADRFTVYTYDRRGRGRSADDGLGPAERELDDLDALIGQAGGTAMAFTHSSGAHVALKAAARGSALTRLALYEPPLNSDYQDCDTPPELCDRLKAMLVAGERGEMVETFQQEWLGMPAEVVAQIRHAPFRAAMEEIAPSLLYEVAFVGTRTDLAAVKAPTLVLLGDATFPQLRPSAQAVADGVAGARLRILPGQNHDLVAEVTGPVVAEFLAG